MKATKKSREFWSVGQIAAAARVTVADVEAAADAVGIVRPDMSLDGVDYFVFDAAMLIHDYFVKRGVAPEIEGATDYARTLADRH